VRESINSLNQYGGKKTGYQPVFEAQEYASQYSFSVFHLIPSFSENSMSIVIIFSIRLKYSFFSIPRIGCKGKQTRIGDFYLIPGTSHTTP
jgi:hypothetical protein